jgi:hypothetical protein
MCFRVNGKARVAVDLQNFNMSLDGSLSAQGNFP